MRLVSRLAGSALGAAIAVAGLAQIVVVVIRTSARATPATTTPGARQFQPTMLPIDLGPASRPPRGDGPPVHPEHQGAWSRAQTIDPRTVFLAGDPTFPMGFVGVARTIEADECGRPHDRVGSELHPADVGARVHPVGIGAWALASALGGIGAFVAVPRARSRRP